MLEHGDVSPAADIDPATLDQARAEAAAVRANEALAHVFGPDTFAEVPITADLNGIRLHGIIDRLWIEDSKILAVDFKTNRVVPGSAQECPDGLLRQMGAYAMMLAKIYPNNTIETAILWTATCELMVLPHDIVSSAAIRALELDGRPSRS